MSGKRKAPGRRARRPPLDAGAPPVGLRIIGGRLRGRKLLYSGLRRLRPMKDRVREAVFNLLGPSVEGKHALDLFAGTGALGLEAISRGAAAATLIEQHFPTAAVIRRNIAALGVQSQCEVVSGDVFLWAKRWPATDPRPWLVFCSPPYDFYNERLDDMLGLLGGLMATAPPQSIFVAESDARFDVGLLPDPLAWDIRVYAPAVIGICRKTERGRD